MCPRSHKVAFPKLHSEHLAAMRIDRRSRAGCQAIIGRSCAAFMSRATYRDIPTKTIKSASQRRSVGTSLSQALQESAARSSTCFGLVNISIPAVHSFIEQAQARFLTQTGDPALSRELAWQALAKLRHHEALPDYYPK